MIFEQLALALQSRVALKFFTVLNILFTFRVFEQLALALKTEFALKIFMPGRHPRPPPRMPMSEHVPLTEIFIEFSTSEL